MRARRMFAIAVLARALPGMKEPDELRDLAIQAVNGIPGAAVARNRAEDVYKLLSGEGQPASLGPKQAPGTDGWWEEMVDEALAAHVLSNTTGMYPRPCIGGMVMVPGVEGPVDALRTEFKSNEIHIEKAHKIDFKRATRYLEPSNWQKCRPDFWCTMEELGEPSEGQRRYHEVVSTHCGQPGSGGFWAQTDLLVNFMSVSDKKNGKAAIANYKLAEKPEAHDFIQVDEGTLVVANAPRTDTFLITSTKRVKFNREIPTGALALMMCAFGYGEVAADLIACAAREGVDPPKGTPFPGVPPPGAPPGGGGAQAAGPRGGPGQAPAGGLVQEVADIWAQAIRDGAAALERNLGGAGQGSAPRTRGPGSRAMAAAGLVDQWSALASRSASRVDAGAYTASSAVEDAAAGATLAAEAGWLWAECAWQAAAKCCGLEGTQNIAESLPFEAPAGAKLKLLRLWAPGIDTFPGVTIHPEQLEPEQTEFTLRTDGTVCRGATYVAEVEATFDEGKEHEVLLVWITVL
jgi:hypothetical protein